MIANDQNGRKEDRLFHLLLVPLPVVGGWLLGRTLSYGTLSGALTLLGKVCMAAGVALGLYLLIFRVVKGR